jgi:hypothetical protein
MEEKLFKIEPGEGIGYIRFRDSIDQVRRLLGRPDKNDDFDEVTTFWSYKTLKLQIALISVDWPLATMEKQVDNFLVGHPATTIWGRRIIGNSEAEVLGILAEKGFIHYSVSDETQGSFKYRKYRFEKQRILLDFRNGLLLSILCGKMH